MTTTTRSARAILTALEEQDRDLSRLFGQNVEIADEAGAAFRDALQTARIELDRLRRAVARGEG